MNKTALITGAGRRIGAVIAQRLHQEGYNVIIHCHQSLAAAQTLTDIMNHTRPNSALMLTAELTLKKAAYQFIEEAMHWMGRFDLLVNNASVFIKTPNDPLDDATWETLFNTNVRAPFWLSHMAYPYLKVQQGSIINITDIHAENPLKEYSIYSQSKAALFMQTKALAREFAPLVRVNAIAPGAIAWPEHDNALSETQQQALLMKTPLRRHGNPSNIAEAVLALAENTFITGQTLRVDGGRSLV